MLESPLAIDEKFINEQIDFVVHSFSNEADEEKQMKFSIIL